MVLGFGIKGGYRYVGHRVSFWKYPFLFAIILTSRSLDRPFDMAAVNNSSPSAPSEIDNYNDKGFAQDVAEKNAHADDDSDASSELKQAGVKQVEAVTQAWSPAMMWLVFTLYALRQLQHITTE